MFNLGDVLLRLVLGNTGDFRRQVQGEAEGSGDTAGKSFGQKMSSAFKTAAGAAVGAFIVGATEQAGKFEDQLRTINTVAKLNDDQLHAVGESIKGLSAETGKSLDDLTGGFYDLVSAGVPADKAISVLRNSAILATGALGSTGEAVDLVTSAMGAFKLSADESARITDIFAIAVADGKTTIADLAQGFSRVAPIAHAAGISLEEIAAATTVMTLSGASASQAYTDVTGSINALLTPNAALIELQKRTGVVFADVAKQKGLAAALEEIRQATNGDDQAFAKILGSSEALTFAFAVTGENAGVLGKELGNVKTGADTGGVALGQYAEKMKSPVEQGKRLVAQIQNVIVTIGTPFVSTLGPAIFAINQLGQAFGLQGIAAKAFGGIIGGLTARLGAPLKKAILGAFASAEIGTRLETLGLRASTLYIRGMTKVDVFTNALRGLWGRMLASGPVQAVIAAAGVVHAKVYALAAAASGRLTTALAGAWAATGGRVIAAAGLTGTAAGTAFSVAAAAAIIAAPLIVLKVALDIQDQTNQQGAALASQAAGFVQTASDKQLADAIAGVRHQFDGMVFNTLDSKNKVVAVLNELIAEQNRRFEEAQRNAHFAADDIVRVGAQTGEAYGDQMIAAAKGHVAQFGPAITSIVKPLGLKVAQAFGSDIASGNGYARAAANRLGNAVARGILEKRDAVDQAWQALLDVIKNGITPARERAKLLGELASKTLAKALHDKRPEVRAQAAATKQAIIDRLAELGANAKNIGKEGMEALRKAMHSKDPDIRRAAHAIYVAATKPIAPIVPAMSKYGYAAGKAYADGLRKTYGLVNDAAYYVASGASGPFKASSPPGPESPLHFIDVWGERTGGAYAEGLLRAGRHITRAAEDVLRGAAGAFMTPYGGPGDMRAPRAFSARPGIGDVTGRRDGGGGRGDTNVTVNVEGLLKARNPFELSDRLRRLGDAGTFSRPSEVYE